MQLRLLRVVVLLYIVVDNQIHHGAHDSTKPSCHLSDGTRLQVFVIPSSNQRPFITTRPNTSRRTPGFQKALLHRREDRRKRMVEAAEWESPKRLLGHEVRYDKLNKENIS